uniref:Uncharacterized protein n=1 Tax=Strigamia maritima TaxID=126957 RepID=T1JLA8_STRMM
FAITQPNSEQCGSLKSTNEVVNEAQPVYLLDTWTSENKYENLEISTNETPLDDGLIPILDDQLNIKKSTRVLSQSKQAEQARKNRRSKKLQDEQTRKVLKEMMDEFERLEQEEVEMQKSIKKSKNQIVILRKELASHKTIVNALKDSESLKVSLKEKRRRNSTDYVDDEPKRKRLNSAGICCHFRDGQAILELCFDFHFCFDANSMKSTKQSANISAASSALNVSLNIYSHQPSQSTILHAGFHLPRQFSAQNLHDKVEKLQVRTQLMLGADMQLFA